MAAGPLIFFQGSPQREKLRLGTQVHDPIGDGGHGKTFFTEGYLCQEPVDLVGRDDDHVALLADTVQAAVDPNR